MRVDESLQDDLVGILNHTLDNESEALPEGSFRRLFLLEQLKAAQAKNKCQIRWHPLIIRWCLALKLTSSAGYHALSETGFLTLPSAHTLRDYMHVYEAKVGIQPEANDELVDEAKLHSLEEYQKFVCVIFDEVKVKEGLVFNKHSGQIIGFVDIGDINNEIEKLEETIDKPPELAKLMLVFMIRGLFTDVCYPYAQFSCDGLDGRKLYPIVWDVI